LRSKSAGKFTTTSGEVPTNGDSVDAEERRDGGHGQTLEFVHHDDSSTSGWQVVECPPHRTSDEKRLFRVVVLDRRVTQLELMPLADRFLAPLISPSVDEYADQPGLFISQSVRNGIP
jgi:hypothetical protein